MSIQIDKEFEALIPRLTDEEFSQLEKNVIEDGCRDALVLWEDILVDGHNRYRICQKHGNVMIDEVDIAKKILDGLLPEKEDVFALLYEPDDEITKEWETNDFVIYQSNPVSVNNPEIFKSIKDLRTMAILYENKRENFLCKHCNIVMTEANLQAYALSQGIETTTSAMSQSEKVALRLQYVLDSTKNAQGDFARTSDSTANQLRILSESLKELAAIAGKELIPMVLPIIKQLNQIIQKVGQLDDGTKDMITKLAVFAAAFGPVLTVSGKLTGAVGSLIGAYKSLKAAQAAATAGQTALNAAMSANAVGAIASAIGVAAAALGSYAIASTLTSEKTADLRDSLNQIEDSYKSSIKSIEKTATAEKAELDIIEKLIPRYEELNKKSNKTATEKAELKNIVDQINDVLPDMCPRG